MKNILGNRDFSTQSMIRETIKDSVNYDQEDIHATELFCFFETVNKKPGVLFLQKEYMSS